jgi:glycosyltransferase involved in cell wall biosynthesis
MSKGLKIAVVSFDWRNLFETNLGEVYEKLERDGFISEHNEIFSINWSTRSYHKKINDNLETVHLHARVGRLRFWYDFVNIFAVPFILMKHRFIPDVVVARDFQSVLSGLAAKLFWGSKIAVILTNVPTQVIRNRSFWQILFLYQATSELFSKYFVDYAVAISNTTKDYLKKLKIPDQKIRMFVPNVIARDKKFIEVSHAGIVRTKYNIPKDKKIILSVGRLESEKNFRGLIDTFHSLQDENLILIIVGEGKLRQELEKQVYDLNLVGRVIFAGFVERGDIWNFYHDADVFILLSQSEGLGLVFWEAMYMRVPVIGPSIEGIAETIGEDGLRGFFWNAGEDNNILKTKISTCYQKTGEIEEMLNRAERYVHEKTSAQGSIDQLLR